VQSTEPEIWKPVLGYDGFYEVSDHGSVRSLDRQITYPAGHTANLRGVTLSQKLNHYYMRVELCREGVQRSWCVHRLVCDAFNGEKPSPSAVIRHLNGDAMDNRAENLRWGTPAENTADMMAHGMGFWANQTHCIRGHEFTAENTRLSNNGHRRNCRACARIRRVPADAVRAEVRRANRPFLTCRVCETTFQGHPHKAFCSEDCKKASRRVAFKTLAGGRSVEERRAIRKKRAKAAKS
jgi:hypothetical protein